MQRTGQINHFLVAWVPLIFGFSFGRKPVNKCGTIIVSNNDKIIKYPVMFRKADLVLITKTDLLPYIDYDVEAEKKEARKLKPNVDILEINIKDDDSIKRVIEWIEFKRKMR